MWELWVSHLESYLNFQASLFGFCDWKAALKWSPLPVPPSGRQGVWSRGGDMCLSFWSHPWTNSLASPIASKPSFGILKDHLLILACFSPCRFPFLLYLLEVRKHSFIYLPTSKVSLMSSLVLLSCQLWQHGSVFLFPCQWHFHAGFLELVETNICLHF